MCEKVLADGYTPLLLQLAKTGVPAGLRGRLWRAALQIEPGAREFIHYAALQREISRVSQVLDSAVRRDACSPFNEAEYFIFAEVVEEAMLAFMRDPSIAQEAAEEGSALVGTDRTGQQILFPPCGSLPPRGLCQYMYPLAYLYNERERLYRVHAALWTRYWCRLHAINSHKDSILYLTTMFERLMQDHAAAVCMHLMHFDLHPTRIAFPWLVMAFSNYLPTAEVLLLWDRVIGFDSLQLLPLLALAIFMFRADELICARNANHAMCILSD